MKKYLMLLALAPLALAMSCSDDHSVPSVAGTYSVNSTTCEDLGSVIEVGQNGDEIQVFFEDPNNDGNMTGTIDEEGNFKVSNEFGSCSGQFEAEQEFTATCVSGNESCTIQLQQN